MAIKSNISNQIYTWAEFTAWCSDKRNQLHEYEVISWKVPIRSFCVITPDYLLQILICIWIFCTPLNLICRPTSSFSIHYILAGKVDLIKMSKYRGAWDRLRAQDLHSGLITVSLHGQVHRYLQTLTVIPFSGLRSLWTQILCQQLCKLHY